MKKRYEKNTILERTVFPLAPTGGFEPLACRLGGGRSILLSYVGKSQAYIFYSRTEAMST